MTTTKPLLQPGVYSVFVLRDDQTWLQPIYRLRQEMTEEDFRAFAEGDNGGFISYGVGADDDAPDEAIREVEA